MMEQLSQQLNPNQHNQPAAQKHAILIHRLEHNLTVGDVTLRQFAQQVRKDVSTTCNLHTNLPMRTRLLHALFVALRRAQLVAHSLVFVACVAALPVGRMGLP
jgi:hypothetical protein